MASTTELSAGGVIVWQFEKKYSDCNQWVDMTEEQSQLLEQKLKDGVFVVQYDWIVGPGSTWHYVIDFNKMTQVNETTGTTRRVRRIRIAPETPGHLIES